MKLKVPRKEADFLREKYYRSFGTTMHGLMYHHNINPYEFLKVVDNVPLESLQLDNELLTFLNVLKENGKHLSIFTNGSRYHAGRVINKLGLHQVIQDVVTLECTGLIPKPNIKAYQYCFDVLKITPNKAVFLKTHHII
nr:HAD family hydrolase [Fastidiosibacter lacustris]